MYKNQYFELDLYYFSCDRAIVEIELTQETEQIHFPEFLKLIKEVTEDRNYKNRTLANSQKL